MTSQRTISLTLTFLAVLLSTAPSSAFANPLLSGYGGPGEGNQAILGSTLVGGPGGGGGSAGGAAGGSSGSSLGGAVGSGARSAQSDATPTVSSGRGLGVRAGGRAAGAGFARVARPSGKASGEATRAYSVSSAENASLAASGETQTLGISGEDVAYIFLALGALAFTGVLTRRLARTSRLEGL
jgi:hypothetical protein